MSQKLVGIDLGTTCSAVAYLDAAGKPETIRSQEGELTTPSVVLFDSEQPIVGREAVKAAEFETDVIARYAKRCVGDTRFPKKIQGEQIAPEVIEALILQQLKRDAERVLGSVDAAVITVPAFFDEARRKATQDAGKIAGLDVLDIINEPTAAAIAYGVHSGFLKPDGSSEQLQRVLVYDLGGGTFDVTVMEIDGKNFNAIATAGDIYLGGVDWDQRLVDHLLDLFEQQYGNRIQDDESAKERLIQLAESTKRTLSVRDSAQARFTHEGVTLQARVSRSDFESMTADLLERTRMTCMEVLKDANMEWKDLSSVILVGGSTRMPMIHQMLEAASTLKVDRSLAPDEAVAHGAAIYAAVVAGNPAQTNLKVNNINSHDLGVLGVDPASRKKRRQIMIPKNSRLPAVCSRQFQTSKTGQRDVLVNVVEGGTDDGKHVLPIGKCVVTRLPDDLPKGTVVKVTFRYSTDGRLSVNAELPDVDCSTRTTIQRSTGMSDSDVEFWKSTLQSGFDIHAKPQSKNPERKPAVEQPKPEVASGAVQNSLPGEVDDSELDELLDSLENQSIPAGGDVISPAPQDLVQNVQVQATTPESVQPAVVATPIPTQPVPVVTAPTAPIPVSPVQPDQTPASPNVSPQPTTPTTPIAAPGAALPVTPVSGSSAGDSQAHVEGDGKSEVAAPVPVPIIVSNPTAGTVQAQPQALPTPVVNPQVNVDSGVTPSAAEVGAVANIPSEIQPAPQIPAPQVVPVESVISTGDIQNQPGTLQAMVEPVKQDAPASQSGSGDELNLDKIEEAAGKSSDSVAADDPALMEFFKGLK